MCCTKIPLPIILSAYAAICAGGPFYYSGNGISLCIEIVNNKDKVDRAAPHKLIAFSFSFFFRPGRPSAMYCYPRDIIIVTWWKHSYEFA